MSKALASKKALPSKEAGLFRELLNFYETRQLKKGLKTADQILKKFAEHGGACASCSQHSFLNFGLQRQYV